MPTIARWLIKAALVCLVAALAVALVRTGQRAGLLPGTPAALWLPQLHLLTVGWITQLIFGVAYWLFPRPREGLNPYWDRAIWVGYGTLNLGLLLRIVAEPLSLDATVRMWGLGLSAGLQWGAGLCFVSHLWVRVRSK